LQKGHVIGREIDPWIFVIGKCGGKKNPFLSKGGGALPAEGTPCGRGVGAESLFRARRSQV